MHIHWKRTLFVFSLSALGVALLALRPAMLSDRFDAPHSLGLGFSHDVYKTQNPKIYESSVTWDITEKVQNALYCIPPGEPNPFDQLKTARVTLTLAQDQERFRITLTPDEIETRSPWDHAKMSFFIVDRGARYRLNAQREAQLMHEAQIVCELTIESIFFRSSAKSYLIVEIMYDPQRGALEVVKPPFYESDDFRYEFVDSEGKTLGFTPIWAGQGLERQLRRVTDGIIQLSRRPADTHEIHELCVELAAQCPHPERAWPASWGEHAELVKELRQDLNVTLALLAQHGYLDNDSLRGLITGADFAHLFGEVASSP